MLGFFGLYTAKSFTRRHSIGRCGPEKTTSKTIAQGSPRGSRADQPQAKAAEFEAEANGSYWTITETAR